MQIHTSDNPAKELGKALSAAVEAHDGDVVCLLSGGSALDVIEYIDVENRCQRTVAKHPQQQCPLRGPAESQFVGSDSEKVNDRNECRTIFMMGDERWSREPEANNTLQLQNRYPEHFVTKQLIATIPEENETVENFAARIEKTFLQKLSELNKPKIFMLLGIGSDGHTAGIFSLPKESFRETYQDDATYVPVQVEGLTIDSRASFTPSWIQNNADEIFAYVVGKSKNTILKSLVQETKAINERPAELIKQHKRAQLFTDQLL